MYATKYSGMLHFKEPEVRVCGHSTIEITNKAINNNDAFVYPYLQTMLLYIMKSTHLIILKAR